MQQVNLGMIGGGTVGSGVLHALQQNGDLMSARLGIKISLRKVAVKSLDKQRAHTFARSLLTTDWQEVVNDPEIHIIIELVGGTGIAKTMVLAALEKGKTIPWNYVGKTFVYVAAYLGAALSLALMLFEDRELS